jgi:hypothetical protein
VSAWHDCPCGCGVRIEVRKLACRGGWRVLPGWMRAALTSAVRRKDWPGHREALANALAWYRQNAKAIHEMREADRRGY